MFGHIFLRLVPSNRYVHMFISEPIYVRRALLMSRFYFFIADCKSQDASVFHLWVLHATIHCEKISKTLFCESDH